MNRSAVGTSRAPTAYRNAAAKLSCSADSRASQSELVRAAQLWLGLLGQAEEVPGVRGLHLVLLPRLGQPFRGVGPHRLQQVVADVGLAGGGDQ